MSRGTKAKIKTYLTEVAKGRPVSLDSLAKHLGVKATDEEGLRGIQASMNNIKRDAERDIDTSFVIRTIVRGQLWEQTNYAARDVEPGPFREEDFVEAPRPQEPEDEEPAEVHRCPFEVIGQTEGGTIVLRNSAGAIYKAVPVE